MSRIIHRQLAQVPPRAVSASGVHIIDADGQRYLDACGGAAVSSMGHAHPDVLAAMHQQIARFGEHGTIDLIAINGYCTLLAMVMNAARTPPPAGPPQPSPPRSPASGGAS